MKLTTIEKIKALQAAQKRWRKFQACDHEDVQAYTEICNRCHENVYVTEKEMIKEAKDEIREEKEIKADRDSVW